MKAYAIYTAATTIALATCLAPQASALDKAPVLSLDLAKKIAAGCEAKATIMRAAQTIDGAMTGKKFLAYVEKCLVVRFN